MRWFFVAVVLCTFYSLALAAPPLRLSTLRGRAYVRRQKNTDDLQTSPTLDASQVQKALKLDGQEDPADGQTASLTSSNNFINFCATQTDVPLTNGSQTKNGSCNPTIMGRVLGEDVMPGTKFASPANLDTIEANKTFTVKLIVTNLQTGHFTNAAKNYFAAPAQVNSKGHLVGHSHIVIQQIPSLQSTMVPDPRKFAFFQGLNGMAVDSMLSATVKGGLPEGFYRMGSITTAANHQPALVAVAQHGMLDDTVYFTVKASGK